MKIHYKLMTAICLAAFTGSLAFSQNASTPEAAENQTEQKAEIQATKITLEEAIEYAKKNSRTLKSNDIDLEIKARATENAWNVLLPSVTLSGTMNRSTEYSPSSAATSQLMASILHTAPKTDFADEEERWTVVGSASVSWNFSLAYIQQIKATKAGYEAGKISWEQSQNETIMNIKKLFYALLLQQENLKIQKETLENARQRMNQATVNYKNGTVPELTLLQTQVNYQNTKPDVDSAEQSLVQQLDTFAFLLGMPVGTKIELSGTIEPVYVDVDVDTLIKKYGENDLTIRSLQNNLEVLKLNKKALNLSTWTPALALNYSWQPAYIGSDGAFHFYKGIGKDDEWYDSGSLSLTLAWNITNMLPWSANRQQEKDLSANISKLELSMETLKENQKVSVRKAVDTLKQAKAQIDAMGRSVTLAQRAYNQMYRTYRNGMTELLDLRDSESALNKAKLGLLNQKFQYISALMELENTLNTNLTEIYKSQPKAEESNK